MSSDPYDVSCLSTRTQNCLVNMWRDHQVEGSICAHKLAEFSAAELLRVPNVGLKTIAEVQLWLGLFGLKLHGWDKKSFADSRDVEMWERAELARLKAKYERGQAPGRGTQEGECGEGECLRSSVEMRQGSVG